MLTNIIWATKNCISYANHPRLNLTLSRRIDKKINRVLAPGIPDTAGYEPGVLIEILTFLPLTLAAWSDRSTSWADCRGIAARA